MANELPLFDYQVEYQARFQPDSSLDVAPTDTAGMGNIVQFVVDSLGHVIPESLVARAHRRRPVRAKSAVV